MIPFEFRLAWRYFKSKRRHPFIGLISKISVLGVGVGVGALIVVLSLHPHQRQFRSARWSWSGSIF